MGIKIKNVRIKYLSGLSKDTHTGEEKWSYMGDERVLPTKNLGGSGKNKILLHMI